MLLTTQEQQLERREEHFSEIFNKDDNKTGSKQEMRNVKENNSKNENEPEVNLDPPTKTEIKLALTQLKNWETNRSRPAFLKLFSSGDHFH